MGKSVPLADDELSSNSSPLLDQSPPQNNVEAESKKRPPRWSRRFVSGARRRVRREANRDRRHSELALEYVPVRLGGMALQFRPMHHPFGATSVPHLVSFPALRGAIGYDVLTPRPAYPKLRPPPPPPRGLCYVVICYVRWLY